MAPRVWNLTDWPILDNSNDPGPGKIKDWDIFRKHWDRHNFGIAKKDGARRCEVLLSRPRWWLKCRQFCRDRVDSYSWQYALLLGISARIHSSFLDTVAERPSGCHRHKEVRRNDIACIQGPLRGPPKRLQMSDYDQSGAVVKERGGWADSVTRQAPPYAQRKWRVKTKCKTYLVRLPWGDSWRQFSQDQWFDGRDKWSPKQV